MSQLAQNLIKEWWVRPLPKIIPRDIKLNSFNDLPVNKIISLVGFRRVGKTYIFLDFARKIGQKNTLYVNFEDERIPKRVEFLTDLIDTLSEISNKKPYTLLFDEIQNIPNWNIWARRIAETTTHRLFITGSSSKLASSELPTELRGRSLSIEVKPLNLNEFIRFKNVDEKTLTPPLKLNILKEYITYGGFPEVVLVDEGKKILLIDEYYKTFLANDIIERHNLRNPVYLQNLIKLLLNSSYYTSSKLTNNLKSIGLDIGKATVVRYLSYLEESFFLKNTNLHTPSIKNRMKAPRKPYFIDNFLISRYSNEFTQNIGRLMENSIANKLDNFYYWKDYKDREVDFVIRDMETTSKLIQVTFASEKSEIKDREVKNLLIASKNLNCNHLQLVTWDLEGVLKEKDKPITLTPLWDFLINK